MNKTQKTKQAYCAPTFTKVTIEHEFYLLASSPDVQPGGGGGGDINVIPNTPDDQGNDDKIEG